MDWTISDGSRGESYTVGRAESESEVEIAGKPGKNEKSKVLNSKKFENVRFCFSYLFFPRNKSLKAAPRGCAEHYRA